MDIKLEAFKLYEQGLSFSAIAKKLGIGKTTCYDYVKQVKGSAPSASNNAIRNGSEQVRNENPERKNSFRSEIKKESPAFVPTLNGMGVPNVPNAKITKPITGNDILKIKFVALNFTGKFLKLIGNPEKIFSAIIWGLPKGGKSNLAVRFADYLHEYFGPTLYVSAEEGSGITIQDKIKDIGGSEVTFYPSKNKEEIRAFIKLSKFCYIFIDSINVAGINDAFLEELKKENPDKSFIAIVQATKGGNFKGEQALEHNCDFVIKVVDGVAYHKGRFGPESELQIFKEALYLKNLNKEKKMPDVGLAEQRDNEVLKLPKLELPKLAVQNLPNHSIVNNIGKPAFNLKEILERNKLKTPQVHIVAPIKVTPTVSLLEAALLITGGVLIGKALSSNNNDE